jgi:hypothetical protein
MEFKVYVGLFGLLCAGLSGCASVAKIAYKPLTSPENVTPDVFDSYLLQTNKIVIAAEKSEAKPAAVVAGRPKVIAAPAPAPKISISSIPTEASGRKIGIILKDDFWSKTKLNLAKIDNTDLLKEAGIEVTNNSVTLINQAGDLIKAVIPLAAAFDAGASQFDVSKTPIEIDTWRLLKDTPNRLSFVAPMGDYPGVKLVFGAIPSDARDYKEVDWSSKTSQLFYAACRDAILTVKLPGNDQSFTVKIADPNFIQRVALPFKGKVTMHSQCGASVQSDTMRDDTSALTIATALATQGKAIADVIKTQKDADDK